MIFIGLVIGLVELIGMGLLAGGTTGNAILNGTLALNSLGQSVWGYSESIRTKESEKKDMNNEVDKSFDSANKLYGIYNNDIGTREYIKKDIEALLENKKVDPYAVSFDVKELMGTGDFDSASETIEFSTYLRGLLLGAGQSVWDIDRIVSEITIAMKNGQDLLPVLEKYNVNTGNIDTDGDNKITSYEVQEYLKIEKSNIDKVFKNHYVPPEYEAYVLQRYEDYVDHEITGVYHESEEKTKLNQLYSEKFLKGMRGDVKDNEGENAIILGHVAEKKDDPYFEYTYYDIATPEFQEATIWAHKKYYEEYVPNQNMFKQKIHSEKEKESYFNKSVIKSENNFSTTPTITNETMESKGTLISDDGLLETMNETINNIYSALLYPTVSTEPSEYDQMDTHYRAKSVYEAAPLTGGYSETLNTVMEQYKNIDALNNNNAVNQTNIMTMLSGVKDDLFFNTSISTTDLLIDTQNANNDIKLQYIIDLLNGLIESLPLTISQNIKVDIPKTEPLNIGGVISNVAKEMLSAKNSMPSRVYK